MLNVLQSTVHIHFGLCSEPVGVLKFAPKDCTSYAADFLEKGFWINLSNKTYVKSYVIMCPVFEVTKDPDAGN